MSIQYTAHIQILLCTKQNKIAPVLLVVSSGAPERRGEMLVRDKGLLDDVRLFVSKL